MELNFKDRTILVTGAGVGIGNEIAKTLYKCGAKVIAVSRSPQPLEDLKKECPGIEIISVDLAGWEETRAALKDVPALDGLVNNAGIAVVKPFLEINEGDFDAQFGVNFKSVFNVCQFLAPRIKDGGSIVSISSLASLVGVPGFSIYGPAKAALDNFTKNLAIELGPRKIRVNTVNPTVIMTRMGAGWCGPEQAEPIIARIPLKRFGEVHEVVEPVLYLLSDRSSFLNAINLPIEGGFLAGN